MDFSKFLKKIKFAVGVFSCDYFVVFFFFGLFRGGGGGRLEGFGFWGFGGGVTVWVEG